MSKSHTKHIASLFDEIAPVYDFLNHLLSLNIDRLWRKKASRTITLPLNAIVVDCCSGTGDAALEIAARHHSCLIYGIDCSLKMLKRAKQKITRKRMTNRIRLIQADVLRLPCADVSVDAVFLSFGLRNLPDREGGLEEIRRILTRHGQVVILEFAPPQFFIFERLYRLYLGTIMPIIGKIVSKSPSAYQYLFTSIAQFLHPEDVIILLKKHGFHMLSASPLMYGMVYLYIAQKETSRP